MANSGLFEPFLPINGLYCPIREIAFLCLGIFVLFLIDTVMAVYFLLFVFLFCLLKLLLCYRNLVLVRFTCSILAVCFGKTPLNPHYSSTIPLPFCTKTGLTLIDTGLIGGRDLSRNRPKNSLNLLFSVF